MTKNMKTQIATKTVAKQNIFIKDIIGENYKKWKRGDIIILDSPVGTGKTTFCEILAKFAQITNDKILYLASRSSKYDEFINDTKQYANVFIYRTYQKLEQDIARNRINELNKYINCKYIFIDECHYFTDDVAIPDSNASLVEEWLINQTKSTIKIYASGTGNQYYKVLQGKANITHTYSAPKDMSYITACYVYKKEDSTVILNRIIEQEPNAKILYFVANTNRMEYFYNNYNYDCADYLCSKNTSDTLLKKLCNITNKESVRINKRILFATKTIDNGINIIDKQLKYVFCEIADFNTIIQCLGRKRVVDEEDTCQFFICNQDAKSLSLYTTKIRGHLRKFEEYRQNPAEFLSKYKNDRNLNKNGSVFIMTPGSAQIQIDKNRLAKYRRDLKYYDSIVKQGFLVTLKQMLDPYLAQMIKPFYSEKEQIIMFLDSINGQRFYEDDRNIIQGFFKQIMPYRKNYGLKTINAWLDEILGNEYKLRLEAKKDKQRTLNNQENPNRDKTYWFTAENI